jgi:hypothetical protein
MWLACTFETPFDCRTVLVSPSASLFPLVLSRYQPCGFPVEGSSANKFAFSLEHLGPTTEYTRSGSPRILRYYLVGAPKYASLTMPARSA